MTFIATESSTERSACAVFANKGMVAFQNMKVGLIETRFLLSALDGLLEKVGVGLDALECVVAGVGPGSFTGIRVSCALAQGIARGLSIPAVGVSSLRAFIPEEGFEGRFLVAIDARMGGIFSISGHMRAGNVTFVTREALVTLAQFQEEMKRCDLLVTPCAQPITQRVDCSGIALLERGPDMNFLGQEGYRLFCSGEVGELKPLYLRATQAEIDLGISPCEI